MQKRKNSKELIIESFTELAKQKSVEKISVSEIVQNCGISRKSFYNSFQDKYDLIEYILLKNIKNLVSNSFNQNSDKANIFQLQDLQENYSLYSSLAKNRYVSLHNIFFQNYYKVVEETIAFKRGQEHLSEIETIVLSMYLHGLATVVLEWLKDPGAISIETMANAVRTAWPIGLGKFWRTPE